MHPASAERRVSLPANQPFAAPKPLRRTPTGKLSVYDASLEKRRTEERLSSFEIQRRRRKYLIDPRSSRLMGIWDVITLTALVFTALITPFEVAFILHAPISLFAINRIVDIIFVVRPRNSMPPEALGAYNTYTLPPAHAQVDMVLQFFLMYTTRNNTVGGGGVHWVENHREIAVHYLKVSIAQEWPCWNPHGSTRDTSTPNSNPLLVIVVAAGLVRRRLDLHRRLVRSASSYASPARALREPYATLAPRAPPQSPAHPMGCAEEV